MYNSGDAAEQVVRISLEGTEVALKLTGSAAKNIAAMLLCLLYALNGFCGDKPVKPITGTWINLAYQDVRNKYTNPTVSDNTGPELWEQKVQELHEMGMELSLIHI